MGGAQTYQWATQYPEFMDIAVPFCTSAKTSLHNQVFLEGVKCSLLAVKNTRSAGSGQGGVQDGTPQIRTWTTEEKDIGLKAMGRVYAGWYEYRHCHHCYVPCVDNDAGVSARPFTGIDYMKPR